MAAGEGGTETDKVVVGLVADPGLPSELIAGLVDDLPDVLARRVDPDVAWTVQVRSHPMTLDASRTIPIVRLAQEVLPREGWDMLLCVSDLPRRVGTTPVVADISTAHSVALASLPALGGIRMRRRLLDTLVYLVGELVRASPHGPDVPRGRAGRPFAPVRWQDRPDADPDASLILYGLRGRARLLLGMVRANRPWRLVPELSTALAAGFAAAAFGIFYSNVWSLADALSATRLTAVTVLAVASMGFWLITHNGLWERRADAMGRRQAVLYNAVTVVSVTIGVACAYAVLFVITFVGAATVIDPGYLARSLGHPVTPGTYLTLAWLASSMGTFAGALGSSLESEDAVHRATYSKRELQRRERRRERERQAEEMDGDSSRAA